MAAFGRKTYYFDLQDVEASDLAAGPRGLKLFSNDLS